MERISSRQNPVVKRFRDLAAGDPSGQWMLLDGEHLVQEARASGLAIETAVFTESLSAGPLATALRLQPGVRMYTVTDQVLAAISPVKQPSGIAAIVRRPHSTIADVYRRQPALVLMLSELQDPGNVGAIVRAAEACGATGVVTADRTADPFGWKALRGAMGSTFRLPIATKQSLEEAISTARAAGLRILAATARGGTPLPDSNLRGPSAILLGGEGPGLSHALVEAADQRVTIPMHSPVESLNVAISAALLLYEASRQRTRDAERTSQGTGKSDVSV
jgi:TrmH family RNA methyltransferase